MNEERLGKILVEKKKANKELEELKDKFRKIGELLVDLGVKFQREPGEVAFGGSVSGLESPYQKIDMIGEYLEIFNIEVLNKDLNRIRELNKRLRDLKREEEMLDRNLE